MQVSQLYIYPIKSLRATPITSGVLSPLGLKYDRRFMLLKVITNEAGNRQLKNMHVPHFPEMALFETSLDNSHATNTSNGNINGNLKRGNGTKDSEKSGIVRVTYNPPTTQPEEDTRPRETRVLEIPLEPSVESLVRINVTMHSSPTMGYDMGSTYNDWFSECFGYPVILAYLGENTREILGSLAPGKQKGKNRRGFGGVISRGWEMFGFSLERWFVLGCFGAVCFSGLSFVIGRVQGYIGYIPMDQRSLIIASFGSIFLVLGFFYLGWKGIYEDRITFADCAPFLLISETSVDDVSARLGGEQIMDRTKFRPNIVVSGANSAFEEDFWTEVVIGEKRVQLLLTGNCVRCQSLNVDYETGQMGTGEAGTVLKKLMKDRRVDRGARFSPVFGRYSFLGRGFDDEEIRVGDVVEVVARGVERSVLDWPGLTN